MSPRHAGGDAMNAGVFTPVTVPELEPGELSDDRLYFRHPVNGLYYRDMKDLRLRAEMPQKGYDHTQDVCYGCDMRGRLCYGSVGCSTFINVGRWREVKTFADGLHYVPPFDP